MTTKDVVPDAVDPSKAYESTSSHIKERDEEAEETPSQIKDRTSIVKEQEKTPSNDAVAADDVADTDGKTTPLKSATMKQKETQAKRQLLSQHLCSMQLPQSRRRQQKMLSLLKAKLMPVIKQHSLNLWNCLRGNRKRLQRQKQSLAK